MTVQHGKVLFYFSMVFALRWGLEKTVSTATQRIGVASQKFTIEVAP
jgi:hypothetical protein